MSVMIHHGLRIYRPTRRKSVLDWELQFFRIQWGERGLHRMGNGKASLMLRINPRNLFIGLFWQPSDDGMQYFLTPFPTVTIRLHVRRKWRVQQ